MAQALQSRLQSIDVSDPRLYQDDTWRPLFAQLRRDDPVHYCEASPYGSYWSVTRYDDIFAVELDHETYSSASELGGIQVADQPRGQERPNFIRMDPPGHTAQRRTVAPIVAPSNLANFERLIRERTSAVLDALPRNEVFDWAERVSVDLTNMMLATLFDFPWEDRDEADLVVGCRDRQCQFARCGGAFRGRAHRRAHQHGRLFPHTVERAGQRAAGLRPDLDDGAFGSHAEHGCARVHRQYRASDRRRQRHHAQFHERRAAGALRKSGAVRAGARDGAS